MNEITRREGRPAGRIPYIDLMEALAMLFVVAYHLSNCRYKFLYEPGLVTTVTYYLRCSFVSCVPLFLVTNGFLLFRHSFDLKKHLIKTLRYAVLTVFWGVITLAEYDYVYGVPLGFQSFLDDLLTWRGGVIHLWYMGALVIIYLLFPVLKLVHEKDRKLLLYVVLVAAVFTFGNQILNHVVTIVHYFRGTPLSWVAQWNWFSMFNPVSGIPGFALVYFCLGAYLEDFLDWLGKFRRTRVNLAAILGLAVGCGVHTLVFSLLWRACSYYYCPIWNGYDSVSSALITLCITVLCANYRGDLRLLRWISSNTLGIYFIHMLIVHPAKERLMSIGPLLNLPGNLLCAAAIVLCCTAITALLRRIPVAKYLVS